jgi:hypothetical protein
MRGLSHPWTLRVHVRPDVGPLLPGVALACLGFTAPWLEASMARHMAIELPLLFVVGLWISAWCARLGRSSMATWNVRGLTGLTFVTVVGSYWMLPLALDMAVLHPAVGMVKVASMVLAGVAAGLSWPGASMVVQAFFAINWVAMTLFAGLLYQSAPQQLCSVYLVNQQAGAGQALGVLAIGGLVLWLVTLGRQLEVGSREPSL